MASRTDEGLISWNIANFVSLVLVIAIVWVVIGTAGHVLVRQPAKRAAMAAANKGAQGPLGPGYTRADMESYGGDVAGESPNSGEDDSPDGDWDV
jgi:hypothetical protein